MGQTLSEPVTDKESACCQNEYLKVGSSSMQGWRINMEDSHCHILSLPDDPGTVFLAVYDGHGGAKVAQYAGVNLHKFIVKQPEYQTGNIEEALRKGFLALDQAMLAEESLRDEMAGSTAIVVLIKNDTLYCANVGDSRAIACIMGKEESLSNDHKPSYPTEKRRIRAAGGWVESNRVNGNLALSRALGDFVFKRNESKPPEEQVVTALPDIEVRTVTSDWEFVLLACDGIWDVMGREEVCDFVRLRLSTGMEPEIICEELMTRCLAPDCHMGGLGCDNMTVVIACFLHGEPFSQLVAKCARPIIVEDKSEQVVENYFHLVYSKISSKVPKLPLISKQRKL
ncbi:probable protein phosphatase 2C T23F11.1 isoform X2 [Neocloeon triangulifer]|nr:probable protein phosphatase 2C T23F11.1 isoform X2 [Neocloeon triangulifer]XP_059485253.1 probable protein phosphatase 2C T23F11.1 isoform X2 [Neocloeon triangulifer]XP_059485254.1 probable protein phosphatase 2C T23F11.1 isoform X2 [Neocloeon triangulifer]